MDFNMDDIRKQLHKEHNNRQFTRWRKNVNNRLPELSSRIFSLRGKHYYGCGFHYDLERHLGHVLRQINTYNEVDIDRSYYHGKHHRLNQLSLRLCVEELFNNVVKIEKELNNADKNKKR